MKINNLFAIFFLIAIDLGIIFAKNTPKRQKRTLVFPTNSAIGIVIAVAYPLILPHRNVFVSYNFEGNYNMPTNVTDIVPGPLNRLDLVTPIDRALGRKNDDDDIHGHKGRVCLLRVICETAEEPFHAHNGVIGDILHIILTPSTSIREDLHPEYYKAEELGRSGDCSKYRKYCPECILDYISQIENF
uniref:Uncharacterized protein n=1 Tax=Lutzomyia longipalpis TaxID=7200 RepID=A0A1B0CF03_LUTLO